MQVGRDLELILEKSEFYLNYYKVVSFCVNSAWKQTVDKIM